MKTILSSLLLIIPFSCFSQLKIGIVAGAQITNMNFQFDLNFRPTTAQINPLFGGFTEYGFKKRFSLAGEILYTPFSYKSNFMEGIDANGKPIFKMATQTITLPDGTNSVVLAQDRFVRGITLNNTWQSQLTLRYTFN